MSSLNYLNLLIFIKLILLIFQGTLTAIMDWFRDYKIPDGKPANKFGLGNKPANKVSCRMLLSCLLHTKKLLDIFA